MHRRTACLAVIAILSFGPTQADTVPQPVAAALDAGAAVEDYRWAFTQTLSSGEEAMVVRFDPRRGADQAWVLVAPEGEAVTKEVTEIFDGIRANARDHDSLGYDDLAETIGNEVTFLREEEGLRVFGFQPVVTQDDAEPEAHKFVANLTGELFIRDGAAGPWVEKVRLYAPDPFKPNMAARVKQFEQVAEYERLFGVPLMRRSATLVAGSAMFQSFEEDVTVTISDIERLGPAAGVLPDTIDDDVPVE